MDVSARFRHVLAAIVLDAALMLAASGTEASTTTPASAAPQAPRVGLVLGGGGARGAAHIGVLRVLEREHIPIHAIAGTSIGAIVGGLYAAGYSPDEIEQAVRSVDWVEMFRDGTARADLPMRQKETDLGVVANVELGIKDGHVTYPTTLVRGQKLGLFLRRMFLGRSNLASFDDLPIPFRCVATDIGVVEPVVFEGGDLVLAVRASMAVPGAFAPVHDGGKVLVDGGVVNNVPIDVVRRMGVDVLIVVDVAQPLEPAESVRTGPQILLQMVSGLMRDRTAASLAQLGPHDVLLRPELGRLSSTGFLQLTDGIAPGVAAAEAGLDRLRPLAVDEAQYLAWRDLQRRRPDVDPTIVSIDVAKEGSRTSQYVRDRIAQPVGEPLDVAALERDITYAYGRGTYESIGYHLSPDANGSALDVIPVDSMLGRTLLRLGIQVNDDFNGHDDYQFDLEARVTGLNSKGAEWRTFVGVGRVSGFATDLYLPFGRSGAWFVDPGASYTSLDQPVVLNGHDVADFRVTSTTAEFRVGRDVGDRLRISSMLIYGEDDAKMLVGDPSSGSRAHADLAGTGVALLWDSLDNVRFPLSGVRAELSYTNWTGRYGATTSGELVRFAFDAPMTFGPNTLLWGARASLQPNRVNAYQTESTLGGLFFLSGLSDRQLLGDQMTLYRAIYYRHVNPERALLRLPVYVGTSLEAGNVWDEYRDVSMNDLKYAGSLFFGVDLPIGALQLGWGHTTTGDDALYLTFGSFVLPRFL
jgi:NTE family protein